MKITFIAILIFVTLAFTANFTKASDAVWFSYDPVVSVLTGTITEEAYGEDAALRDRGARAWILRLDHPISVKAAFKDEINVQELDVSEVHLNIDHHKFPIKKKEFGTAHFAVTGTLFHQFNSHHLRPIVLLGSGLKPANPK